jgi:hypothetical protein
MGRRRLCLVRGRLRVPFKGYERHRPSSPPGQDEHFGVFDALPLALRFLALRRLAEAEARRPLARDRMKYLGRLAGIASAVRGGRVGNQRWAHHMASQARGPSPCASCPAHPQVGARAPGGPPGVRPDRESQPGAVGRPPSRASRETTTRVPLPASLLGAKSRLWTARKRAQRL